MENFSTIISINSLNAITNRNRFESICEVYFHTIYIRRNNDIIPVYRGIEEIKTFFGRYLSQIYDSIFDYYYYYRVGFYDVFIAFCLIRQIEAFKRWAFV